MSTPNDQGEPIELTLAISAYGYHGTCRITARSQADLQCKVAKLIKANIRPLPLPPQPLQSTPDGRLICPRHGVPMRLREKQGQSWWSHNTGSKDHPVYCKGYEGPDSPGWDFDPAYPADSGHVPGKAAAGPPGPARRG